MILAAAAHGEDPRAAAPYELRLAWQALGYHALPEAGGLLDQPPGLLNRMTQAYNAWFACKSYRKRDLEHSQEWMEANPDLFAIVQRVRKLREHHA